VANRLRGLFGRDAADITVIDPDDKHVYQPGLLFVPFGKATPAALTRSRSRQFRPGVTFRQAAVDRVDLEKDEVWLADGTPVGYDVLVIATGARLVPGETEGLTGPGWNEKVFTRLAVAVLDPADQVPGRAAGVLLPRRLVPPQARHQGQGGADLRHPA
jgi:sulfide:quinone oxidoreductase